MATSAATSFLCCLLGLLGYWAASVCSRSQVARPRSSRVTGPTVTCCWPAGSGVALTASIQTALLSLLEVSVRSPCIVPFLCSGSTFTSLLPACGCRVRWTRLSTSDSPPLTVSKTLASASVMRS